MTEVSEFTSLCADLVAAADLVPLPCPRVLPGGRYILDEVLSIGPRSWVYRGRDLSFAKKGFEGAPVVIKIFRRTDAEEDESLLARWTEHPHVVKVLDRGRSEEGYPYLVEEFLREGDMSRVARPVPLKRALTLAVQVAGAVQHLHHRGIVHCDIKPSNVLLETPDHARLADFELAASAVTESESFRGTRAFMAPEQLESRPGCHSPPTDIYAIGRLLGWLLEVPPGTPGAAAVPARLARVIERATAHDPAERHPSAQALADDLRAVLEHRPIAWQRPSSAASAGLWCRRRPALAVGVIALAVMLIALGVGRIRDELAQVEQRLAIEQAALREAQVEIARLKSEGREAIGRSIRELMALRAKNSPEALAARMAEADPFIGSDDPLLKNAAALTIQARLGIARAALDERLKRGDGVETLGTRLLLAGLLIDAEQPAEAGALLRELRATWSDRLPADDPIWRRVRALELCAAAPETDVDRAAWLVEVRRLLVEPGRLPAVERRRLEARLENLQRRWSSAGAERPGASAR